MSDIEKTEEMQERFDEIEKDLQNKIEEMKNFRQQMRKRRVQEQIEEDNPFAVPKTKKIDTQLQNIYQQDIVKGQAGIVDEKKVNEILERVKESLNCN